MTPRDQLAKQALALPPDDRAFLADLLEQSLADSNSSHEEIRAAWTVEIDRRIEAYRQDKSRAIDADDALAQIEESLAQHRTETPK